MAPHPQRQHLLEDGGGLDVITVMVITTAAIAVAALLVVLGGRFRHDAASVAVDQSDRSYST